MSAAHDMIVSVYSVLEALPIVRLNSGFVDETITLGKRANHSVSTAATMVAAPKPNAHPSRSRMLNTSDITRQTAATAAMAMTQTIAGAPCPAAMKMVQIRNAAATAT